MITLEKKCKIYFFCGKNQGPNQWFCSDKKSKQNKKNPKKKKKSCSLFVQIWSSKWCVEIYLKRS